MNILEKKKTIAILYICTGKYTIFWKDFFLSCEKYFIPEMKKEYFVFTDAKSIDFEEQYSHIHRVFQNNLGWPGNTLYRYHMFLREEEKLRNYDYIFFFNANVLFLSKINAYEFLPQEPKHIITTLHPGYLKTNARDFDYERNPESCAYIEVGKGKYYAQGGINGGISNYFLEAMKIMGKNIEIDKNNHITAIWHDESHWNRYLFEHPDNVKILGPEYNQQKEQYEGKIKILLRNKLAYGNIFFKFFILRKSRILSYNFWHQLIKEKLAN